MIKIILICISLILPVKVYASSVDYDITDFLIDAQIEENGDMFVKELIVLDGEFNGYIRELQYQNPKLQNYTKGNINFANSAIYNATGIKNVTIFTKKMKEEEITFSTFKEIFIPNYLALNDKNVTDGNYVLQKKDDFLSYKIYQKAENEKIAFLITYTIEDAVVIHEDVAELYWNFIGSGFDDKIYNLQIQLHLPQEDNSESFHFWAHGDITGEIDKIDNQTIIASMKSLEKNTIVDLRVTFNSNLIPNQQKLRKSEQKALEKILELEEKRAQDANKKREIIRIVFKMSKKVTNVYFIIIAILWFIIYWKFDKEYKSDFQAKYYREFTGIYNVEVIDYLMNKTITPNAMSASIMNLIYKKNIEIEKESTKKEKYKFILKNTDNTTETERLLIDFLFEEVGKNQTFTPKDLEKYAKNTKTCEKFSRNYTNWKNCVIKDAEQEKFYENNGIPVVIGILNLLITIMIFLVFFYYHVDYVPSYFLLPLSIIFLIYTIFIKKRTKRGNEDYLKWKAFKNFLNDFGNFKVKELPEIILWEKYLVYATVFGLADQVEKIMNVKIKEYPNATEYFNGTDIFYSLHLYQIVNQSVHLAHSTNITSLSSNINSRNSSGSGSGGGFSSGSGFGGGSGGGRGF